MAEWDSLRTDEGAQFDAEVHIDASTLTPFVTWGTNPGQGVPLGADVPDPELMADEEERLAAEKALTYMDLTPGTPMREIPVDTVFVGSCTNGGSRTYGPSRTCCGTGRWPQGSPCSSFPAR
ncbi:aconitase family protein [Mycobacteroides abscessus 21]|uniref:Aconitase family protein n=1 Tax=Mycobacteroides abscessus 21 TaxID=1299324 RepID=A0A829Q4Y5_9MYCO|nr:aconitase family protein [Mycobacteroides abscessus 21]